MKGQFMMLSALIVGLIMISAASVISSTSSLEFEPDEDAASVYMIKDEAQEYDTSQEADRRALERMVESTGRYTAEVEEGSPYDNLTVRSQESEYVFQLD